MGTIVERLKNGIARENPVFVQLLGMCPTLAVTTSASNGLGMGLTTTAVLSFSNMIISMVRKIVPDKVRIPSYIVIIASLVTLVQMLLEAYLPDLNKSLGLYIPLIVVNCIILGRAEAFASKNNPVNSLFDGLGMGLGFSVALTLLGGFRELFGTGAVFGTMIMPEGFVPATIFILAPGGFIILACLMIAQNVVRMRKGLPPKELHCVTCGLDEYCGVAETLGDKKPAAEAKPAAAKPAAAKPETSAKPEAPAKAEAAVKTEAAAKPEAPAKAEATTKVEVPAKAEEVQKPEVAAKTQEPVKAQEPAKAEAPQATENTENKENAAKEE